MLDIEILKSNYSISFGSVILKSLQNDNVPELDLLVREAIQNSSDASSRVSSDRYEVHFNYNKFCPKDLNVYLTDIEDEMNERFCTPQADFLEIRDIKTEGLTGKVFKKDINDDNRGNYFKLVFDTGKRQTESRSGGNWGFGKSVYYRVGIGLVIYYSRIHENDKYEERMIFTLIENEELKDDKGESLCILKHKHSDYAGRAWWGIREGEDLLPLTDPDDIYPILDVFKLKPFKGEDTGTSIIIPYLRSDELLESVVPDGISISEDIRNQFVLNYLNSIPNYLELAVQKWYAPKLQNNYINNINGSKKLLVEIGHKWINQYVMLPFFALVQELYLQSLAEIYKKPRLDLAHKDSIKTSPIRINNYFENGNIAGYISYISISKSELNGDAILFSPYMYIGKYDAEGNENEPVVMYSRDPGMIIDYSTSGEWNKRLPTSHDPDEYLFIYFVPATENRIKQGYKIKKYAGMVLGDYLKECEVSDHMGWNDPVKMSIVQNIQNRISATFSNIARRDDNSTDSNPSMLSNKLAKTFMPRNKKGRTGSSGSGSSIKQNNVTLDIKQIWFEGNDVNIPFELKMMHNKKECSVEVLIVSEQGRIDAKSWKTNIGTVFPIVISECFIYNIRNEKEMIIEQKCDTHMPSLEVDGLTVELQSDRDGFYNKVVFCAEDYNSVITGIIKLTAIDKKYRYYLKVE